MKPKRPPPNTPRVGDRVRLRGREPTGTLRGVNPENQWSRVEWDRNGEGPRLCHLYELEKIE